MLPVPQAARRTMEGETAADRVGPVREGGADVLARQAVMRVAQAYESATPWKSRRPDMDPNAVITPQPAPPPPEKATISQARRDEIAAICKRAGLTVPDNHFEQLCAAAPYVEEMVGHLESDLKFHDEPASVFQFSG